MRNRATSGDIRQRRPQLSASRFCNQRLRDIRSRNRTAGGLFGERSSRCATACGYTCGRNFRSDVGPRSGRSRSSLDTGLSSIRKTNDKVWSAAGGT